MFVVICVAIESETRLNQESTTTVGIEGDRISPANASFFCTIDLDDHTVLYDYIDRSKLQPTQRLPNALEIIVLSLLA